MKWEEFTELSVEQRMRLFFPTLIDRANKCLARYKKDYRGRKVNDRALDRLLDLSMQFCFYFPKGGVSTWARQAVTDSHADAQEYWPQNRGEEFLALIGYYGPLCFGWRVNRTNTTTAPGLIHIIHEHYANLPQTIPFLCFTDLRGKTMEETVRLLDKWGESVSLAALKKMISRLW